MSKHLKSTDLVTIVVHGDWNEEDHPRADDGKWTSGGGGGGGDGEGEEYESEDKRWFRAKPSNDNARPGAGRPANENFPKRKGRDERSKGGYWDHGQHPDNDNDKPPPRGPNGGRRLKKAA